MRKTLMYISFQISVMARKDSDFTNEFLDTSVHTEDYVDQLFKNIDWNSRKKQPMSETRWLEPETWRTQSYTMKYLGYRLEEGQVDLSNPFHIEEGNKIRTRLERKRAKKVERVIPLYEICEDFIF